MSDLDWPLSISVAPGGPDITTFDPPTKATYRVRNGLSAADTIPQIDPTQPAPGPPIERVQVTAFEAAHRLAFGTIYTPGHYQLEAIRRLSNGERLVGSDVLLDALTLGQRWRLVSYYLALRGLRDRLSTAADRLRQEGADGKLKVWGRSTADGTVQPTSSEVPLSAFFAPAQLDFIGNRIGVFADLRFDIRDQVFAPAGELVHPVAQSAGGEEEWRLRPGEYLNSWFVRPESEGEAKRRAAATGKKVSEMSICRAFEEMSAECGRRTAADSIKSQRYQSRHPAGRKKLPE